MADISKYIEDIKKYDKKVDEELVQKIVNYLGIALRSSKDAAMVSCSQKDELARVRNNLMKKKCGLTDDDATLDKEITAICEKMGKSNRNKSRVTFYYLLIVKLGKESIFIKK